MSKKCNICNYNKALKVFFLVFCAHFLCVFCVALLLLHDYGQTDENIQEVWFLFLIIDFPLGPLCIPLWLIANMFDYSGDNPYYYFLNNFVIIPALYFQIVGTVNWTIFIILIHRCALSYPCSPPVRPAENKGLDDKSEEI
jgi:hypothetical protein